MAQPEFDDTFDADFDEEFDRDAFGGSYDGRYTAGWMRRFAESVLATRGELTALDQRAGDGDFGVNLSTGLSFVLAGLDQYTEDSPEAAVPLNTAAEAFLDEVGGTSGPLFGLLIQELADAARATPTLTARSLALGAGAGLAAIQRVGDAEPGDKTLVDALLPAVRAMEGVPESGDPGRSLHGAARAAWGGVRETAQLSARRGRASYLGERAAGVPDPGAVGVALLFSSAARKLERLPSVVSAG